MALAITGSTIKFGIPWEALKAGKDYQNADAGQRQLRISHLTGHWVPAVASPSHLPLGLTKYPRNAGQALGGSARRAVSVGFAAGTATYVNKILDCT